MVMHGKGIGNSNNYEFLQLLFCFQRPKQKKEEAGVAENVKVSLFAENPGLGYFHFNFLLLKSKLEC